MSMEILWESCVTHS